MRNEILSDPQAQKVIATTTISAGGLFLIKAIPFVLGIIATSIGILASWTIYKKNRLEIKIMLENRKKAKERKEKGLPLRRKTDEEVNNE